MLPLSLWVIVIYLIIAHAYKWVMTVVTYPPEVYRPSPVGSTLAANIMPPLSVIVSFYNKESTVVASIIASLHLNYPQAELVVVNDGSTDNTLQMILQHFVLAPFPEHGSAAIPTSRIRAIYRSSTYPTLWVIDKEHGGMADSLNAGINASHAGLFIHIDDNIVLHEEGLSNLVQPFVSDSTVVSSSGTLRRTHKHLVRDGQLFDPKLPLRWTDQFSLIDTFRPPWVAPSMGTIAIFKKSAVIKQGGYRFGGSDSELQTRLRSALPSLHYSIRKVNEPFFLIQAEPLDPSRILDLSLYPSMGMRGWSALFATLFFEWLFPILETVGLLMVMEACFKGLAGAPLFASYLGFCIILRTTRAALEILLEAIVFRIYRHPITLVRLFLATAIQNLGYRQYQDWKQFFLMMNWVTRWTEPRPS